MRSHHLVRRRVVTAAVVVSALGAVPVTSAVSLAPRPATPSTVAHYTHHRREPTSRYHPVGATTVYGGKTGTLLTAGRPARMQLRGHAGVPRHHVTAVVVQVTASRANLPGALTAWRGGHPPPVASFADSSSHPVEKLLTVATSGPVALALSNGHVKVRVDLLGYYSIGQPHGLRLVTLPATVSFDTQRRRQVGRPTRLAAGASVRERVVGRGVPRSAAAIVLDLETVRPGRSGWLSVTPAGRPRPASITTTYVDRGRTEDTTTIVPVGRHGRIAIADHAGGVDLVGIVEGYFLGGQRAGADPYVPVPTRRVFFDPTLRQDATEDVTPSEGSAVPATGVRSVAVMVHVIRPTGSPRSASGLTSYAECAGDPTLQVPGHGVAETYEVVPVGPDGRFTLSNAIGSVAVSVDVVGYYPASSPVTVSCVALTAHHTRANPRGAIEIFDAEHFSHWSESPTSPSMKSRWVPHLPGLGELSDVKLREFDGHQYLVAASTAGGLAVIPYPALSHPLFATDVPGTAWHGIELLPDGTIVVAAATSDGKRGPAHGFAGLYYRHDGGYVSRTLTVPTCAIPAHINCDDDLGDAHEVLWDPRHNEIWGVGVGSLVVWAYRSGRHGSAPTATEVKDYSLIDTTGQDRTAAHDLQPVSGSPNLMWVSGGRDGVEVFSKVRETRCNLDPLSPVFGDDNWCPFRNQAELQSHHVKSIGSRSGDNLVMETWPDGEQKCSSCTATVHFLSFGGALAKRTVRGASFYRARWWNDRYL